MSRKMATVLISVLLMASVMPMAIPAIAQTLPLQSGGGVSLPAGVTPDLALETIPYLSFRPNPVGLGQDILVNIWLQPPIHISRYLTGLTVTITKPDGTKDVVGPIETYKGDGTAWFERVVDQIGTWKIKFDFPGNFYPAGIYFNQRTGANETYPQSVYYKPSSTVERELTVQESMVYSWPPSPLPTDYWTRPIPIENREWWIIGGHYPFSGQGGGPNWPADTNTYASNYKFTPYVQAPNTAHVAWKQQGALAGIIGGQFGQRSYGPGEGTYAGTPAIIFQGRGYQTITKPFDGVTQTVWQCYDIRTGEVYWERTGVSAPTAITYNKLGASSVPGAGETGSGRGGSWGFARLVYIGGGRMIKYDPWTGAVAQNVSISPLSTGTIVSDPYILSVQTIAGKYYLVNWTLTDYDETGAALTMAQRIQSNVSYPFSSVGTADFEAGIAVTTYSIMHPATGVAINVGVRAASLTTGKLLWNVSSDVNFNLFSGSTAVADQGKFAVRFDDGYWYCWDLYSGKRLWRSESEEWPWGCFGAYNVASAYGTIFDLSYAGIYALKWDTGKIAWRYDTGYPGYEAAFSSYPVFTNPQVADGKLYVANGEHSPTEPLMRGWKLHCINATTGEGIWNITGGGTVGAIADGYVTFDSRYDGYLYVFGKGKSATTVTTPDTATPKGTTVVIKGAVLDQSPAQPGTPCVSKDSMATQMEYLHMQQSIGGLWGNETITGVPVILTALGSDGSSIDIGTVTTDGYYGTFSKSWAPPEEGDYKIIASFAGDDSYGSSSASTAMSVGPAPEPIQFPQQIAPTDYTMTIISGVIAVIIAVAIVGILLYRKK